MNKAASSGVQNSLLSKTLPIDERLESYESFFDHSWAQQMMVRTLDTPIDPLIFDLCIAWRGIANTFALPHIMVSMFMAFSKGLAKSHEPLGIKVVGEMRETLVARMGGTLNPTKQRKLQSVISDIYQKTRDAVEKVDPEFDRSTLWSDLRDEYEMRFAILGSQRLAYAALYYSYEDFLVRCVKLQFGVTQYRLKRGEQADRDFSKAFGDEACAYCWQHEDVRIARETRNSLVHNGGRQTQALHELEPDMRVGDDKELHLMAPHVRVLHNQLKDRVTHLVGAMLPNSTDR